MLNFNSDLREIADAYCASVKLAAPVRGHYVPVDHVTAGYICRAYDRLPAIDHNELVKACYARLAREVVNQYIFLTYAGYTFQPWQQDGQPYANSSEMAADVRENKHLWFFTGGDVHPFLGGYSGVTLDGIDCSVNDIFRAVHDVFGHACEGYSFGQRGEENAWIHHSMMFSPDAQWALTTETRGQNSWVNENEANKHLPACKKAFAAQKAALLSGAWTRIPDSIALAWKGSLI